MCVVTLLRLCGDSPVSVSPSLSRARRWDVGPNEVSTASIPQAVEQLPGTLSFGDREMLGVLGVLGERVLQHEGEVVA